MNDFGLMHCRRSCGCATFALFRGYSPGLACRLCCGFLSRAIPIPPAGAGAKAELRSAVQDASRATSAADEPTGFGLRARQRRRREIFVARQPKPFKAPFRSGIDAMGKTGLGKGMTGRGMGKRTQCGNAWNRPRHDPDTLRYEYRRVHRSHILTKKVGLRRTGSFFHDQILKQRVRMIKSCPKSKIARKVPIEPFTNCFVIRKAQYGSPMFSVKLDF